MLSVLVVDDSHEKARKIETCVRSFIRDDAVFLRLVASVAEARRELRERQFELLVLDMNVPIRDGEDARRDGGVLLLGELEKVRDGLRVPTHVVGLSEYPELVEEYGNYFAERLWYLVRYDGSSEEWARRLGQKLVHIVEAMCSSEDEGFDYDLAIVTALEPVELEAVIRLPAGWRPKQWKGDATIYRIGKIGRGRRRLKVVAAAAGEMGMPATTALSMKLVERFRPRVLAMTGIAAGVKGAFGDILVADQSWDYGSGKRYVDGETKTSKFGPAPTPIQLHPVLRAKLSRFGMDGQVRARIRDSWVGNAPEAAPTIRTGPLASGASVVADRAVIDEIVSHNRKLVGVEMEAYGVFLASVACREPRPMPLVVKSICDFGGPEKDDAYQSYAAHTSSRFIYEFSLAELIPDGGSGTARKARRRT
jgi:nucleoside phosphorylase